jgi:hypothetical protein
MRTVVVCLPEQTQPGFLPELATCALAVRGVKADGVVPHFLTTTRRHRNRLVDCWQQRTSGGPIRLLDLYTMRQTAMLAATAQWTMWQHVVGGTHPAQPFWHFADRHTDNPRRYPLARAQNDYRAQPRILAMAAYNACPNRPYPLPTADLEAFQAGQSTYARLAWLAAVPAHGLAVADDPDGGWLTTKTERLADQLEYLHAANAWLARLGERAQLVAMATPG